MSTSAQVLIGADDAQSVQMGSGFGVRFMVEGAQSHGAFALVEHPIGPRQLAAPRHTHSREDEYTYVLEGEVGVAVGDDAVTARPGELVFKPRGIPHAVWNTSDQPARMLEIISPAGFERYYQELAALVPDGGMQDTEALTRLWIKYGLDMDVESVGELTQRHGVSFGPAP